MSSLKLDPYKAPTSEEFISLFQPDIINFLQKKIVKDFNHIDLNDLSHDFIAHAYSDGMLKKYRPDFNVIRVGKITRELQEKEQEFQILKKRNHQTPKDLKILQQIQKEITKKQLKLKKCQENVNKLVRFKTYLFWCLKSYWWWNIVKMVDIYADADGVIREHIKTTPPPLVVSQIAADDDYKFSDVSSSIYLKQEETLYQKELSRQAAKYYLNMFENFLRSVNEHSAMALGLLVSGMEIEDVAVHVQMEPSEVMAKLKHYGDKFSLKMGSFSECLEYA